MSIDKSNIDLNAPAFGAGAQKLEDLVNDAHKQTAEAVEPIIQSEGEDESEPSEEETKVPYSRFKKFHDEAKQAREDANYWRQQAEEIEQSRAPRYTEESSNMPSEWREMYGDSEASQKAWKLQERREQEIMNKAYEAGQRGAEELEIKQQQRIENNVATIDDSFESLSDFVGRDLTAKEQSAILDIVDDFTPKDNYGRYAGPLIPFEKAWEMYELKQNSGKTAQRKDRDSVAALSGTSSQGDTDVTAEQNKNFNPLARGTWKSRL